MRRFRPVLSRLGDRLGECVACGAVAAGGSLRAQVGQCVCRDVRRRCVGYLGSSGLVGLAGSSLAPIGLFAVACAVARRGHDLDGGCLSRQVHVAAALALAHVVAACGHCACLPVVFMIGVGRVCGGSWQFRNRVTDGLVFCRPSSRRYLCRGAVRFLRAAGGACCAFSAACYRERFGGMFGPSDGSRGVNAPPIQCGPPGPGGFRADGMTNPREPARCYTHLPGNAARPAASERTIEVRSARAGVSSSCLPAPMPPAPFL